MAVLRVLQLYAGLVTSGSYVDLYTVPTGHRVVLRDIVVRNHANAVANAYARLDTPSEIMFQVLQASGNTGCDFDKSFWLVMSPGQKLQAASSQAGGVYFTVSGSIYYV